MCQRSKSQGDCAVQLHTKSTAGRDSQGKLGRASGQSKSAVKPTVLTNVTHSVDEWSLQCVVDCGWCMLSVDEAGVKMNIAQKQTYASSTDREIGCCPHTFSESQ